MNYLEKGTRLGITYPTHLWAWFCEDPREPHAVAVEYLVCYLHGTKKQGNILRPDKNEGLKQGNCTRRPQYGAIAYQLRYHLCKLPSSVGIKGTIDLCAQYTESEYYALSTALHEVIMIISFLREIKACGIADANFIPEVHCKGFDDNSGALELARLPKM
eukprot:15341633-Ditylum_brightwellii.AAC.1